MKLSKRKELRVYYLSNSYDDQLIEFIKDYASAKGQSYTEVVLEILRTFWLPIALRGAGIDPLQLKDLRGKSIGLLRSQLNLFDDDVTLMEKEEKQTEDFDDSVEFETLF